jgi:predicted acylesterase/phospholipase RssA
MWRKGLAGLALAALAGCGASELPPDLACAAMGLQPEALRQVASAGPTAQSLTPTLTEERTVTGMAEALVKRERQQGARVDVLLLSSGGQWGAFSAGFLNGWSENTADPRPPRFEVVTGVSTGALQAPFAFAGRAYDATLKALYDGISERRIFTRRSSIELLTAPSLWNPRPLERQVSRHLTPALIRDLAEASETRSLLVGAVNLQSGFFEAFDLTAMAASGAPSTKDCLREGLLASAAIPLAFPPRRIGGSLFADGAARQGLFLQALADADLRPTVYILVNNAVAFRPEDPAFALPSLVGRTQAIVTDELLRQSTIEAVRFARQRGWTVRGAVAPDIFPGPDCFRRDGSELAFCPSFTRALFEAGFEQAATGKIRWLGANALIAQMQRDAAAARGG